MGKRDIRKRETKKPKVAKRQQEVSLSENDVYTPEVEVVRKPRKVREEDRD
jgi:hypothetical protein